MLDVGDAEKVALMDHIRLSFAYNESTDTFEMVLNGENVEQEIRKLSVAAEMHKIVSIPGIRARLVALQRAYGDE